MAITKTIEINVDSSKASKSIQNLNQEIDNTSKSVDNTKGSLKDFTSVADGMTGGVISKFGSLTGTLGKVAGGFKGIGTAIAASGIGLLVLLIGSVISAFKASEEGQNKFAKLMGVIGSVVGNVMDVISDLGEIIIGVLSGDSEAIKSATAFGKKIFDVVGLPIKNIISVVQTAANVIKGLWNDGIDGALTALENGVKDVKGNFKDAANAINDGANALKNFGEEALKEAKIAQQIADQRAKADKTERNLIVQRAEGDRKIAELREKAVQRDIYSASQRIAFLKEAQAIETNLTNQEIAAAKLRADAKTKENALSKSTKEDLLEEENLKAKVIQLETQRLQGNRRLVSQIQSLQREESAIRKAATDERKKQIEEEQKKKEDAIKKEEEDEKKKQEAIENVRKTYKQKLEDLEDVTEVQKVARQQERALEELKLLEATNEQKAELLQYYSNLKLEAQKKDNAISEEEEKKTAAAKEEIAKREAEAKLKLMDVVSNGLSMAASELGESTAAGKAAAVAAATISTYTAIAGQLQAFSKVPIPGYAIAQAILTGAQGLLQVKKILSVKVPKGGSGGSSAPSIALGGGGGTPAAPQFNVVGNSGINQIAQTLGQQQPIQTYVVANNVTTAQSLDRNIISNASLG